MKGRGSDRHGFPVRLVSRVKRRFTFRREFSFCREVSGHNAGTRSRPAFLGATEGLCIAVAHRAGQSTSTPRWVGHTQSFIGGSKVKEMASSFRPEGRVPAAN